MANKQFFPNPFPDDNGEIIDWVERAAIEFRFIAISQHLDFVNSSINQELNHLESMAHEFVQTLDMCAEERGSMYYSLINGGSANVFNYEHSSINEFYLIQWRSEFLVIYSYFEHILNHLCKVVQERSNFKLGFKNIDGAGIERARTYLVKVANVDKPFKTKNWQRAKLLSEIRNVIAHSNSEIKYTPNDSKTLCARLKKEVDLKLEPIFPKNELAEIMLSHQFLKQSLMELKAVVLDISNFQLYP